MNVVEISVIKSETETTVEELETFCLHVLDDLGKKNWTVSVLLCDDAYIRQLNARYRGIDEPTDVLSFSQDAGMEADGMFTAGDVVVSIESMRKNAIEQCIKEADELKRLLVHGVLHLAGMDHKVEEDEERMLDLQERLLSTYSGGHLHKL